jgi:uncharacterized membrane protein
MSTSETVSSDNVLVVTFGPDPKNDPNAYQALTNLKELDTQGQIEVVQAAVIERGLDGQVTIKSDVGNEGYIGTTTGGVVGVLIGVLGGPLGVLIGGATGLVAGALFDEEDDEDTDSVLTDISKQVHPTRTAVLAQVSEPSYEVVDTAMSQLGGTVLRRPLADVEGEIAAAQDAQRAAKEKARKELREARHEKQKEQVQSKLDELRSKLHKGDKAPAGTAS